MFRKCIRCGKEKRITSFKKCKHVDSGRLKTCRYCYDHNQLEKVVRTPEQIESQRSKMLGRKYSVEHRLAISKGQLKAVAEGRHRFKRGKVPHKDNMRCTLSYNLWKDKVYKLKGRKCEQCSSIDNLCVHHIESFCAKRELALVPENGKVLCASCHGLLHNLNKKGKPHSEETRRKIGIAHKGMKKNITQKNSGWFPKGQRPIAGFKKGHEAWNKGKSWSDEIKKKISDAKKSKNKEENICLQR